MDFGSYVKEFECKKVKNYQTTETDSRKICFKWKVIVKQSIYDVCNLCERKMPSLLSDMFTWKPLLPSRIINKKEGRVDSAKKEKKRKEKKKRENNNYLIMFMCFYCNYCFDNDLSRSIHFI